MSSLFPPRSGFQPVGTEDDPLQASDEASLADHSIAEEFSEDHRERDDAGESPKKGSGIRLHLSLLTTTQSQDGYSRVLSHDSEHGNDSASGGGGRGLGSDSDHGAGGSSESFRAGLGSSFGIQDIRKLKSLGSHAIKATRKYTQLSTASSGTHQDQDMEMKERNQPVVGITSMEAEGEGERTGRGLRRGRELKFTKSKSVSMARQYQNYARQSWIEIRHNKCQFCIGCTSIFLVVFVVAVALSTLSYSSIFFLGLSEAQSGEIDLTLSPRVGDGATPTFLNYTRIIADTAMHRDAELQFHMPRMEFVAAVQKASSCPRWSPSSPNEASWAYMSGSSSDPSYPACRWEIGQCANYNCHSTPQRGRVVVIDTARETTAQLGRGWKYPPIPIDGCYLQSSLANFMQVSPGEYLVFGMYWTDSFPTFARVAAAKSGHQPTHEEKVVYFSLKVLDVFDGAQGKWPQDYRNVIVLEYSVVLRLIASHLNPSLSQTFRQSLASMNPYDAVPNVHFNLPPPRFESYSSADFAINARVVVPWASKIVYLLGLNQIYDSVPLLDAMQNNNYAVAFLNLILNIMTILLSAISILLIYSLLLISIEARTFELGVLRMVGLPRSGLVQMLLVHSLMFAIPAWIIGLLFSQGCFFVVSRILYRLTDVKISPLLTGTAVVASSLLGLGIPLIASILPIKSALTVNLHDALDTLRSKTKAVKITVERSSVHNNLLPVLLVGFLLTFFGFMIYYVLPLALVSLNLSLLFNIFLGIMLGMLGGLVLMSLNLQPLLESALIWVLFKLVLFFENKAIPHVIKKNLVAHRLRNRKTAISYATSLGFIIFLAVAMSVELRTLEDTQFRKQGSPVRLRAWDFDASGTPYGIQPMEHLEGWANAHPYLEDYAWVSYHLFDLSQKRTYVGVSNIGKYVKDQANVYAASPNIFDVVKPGFFQPSLYDSSSPLPVAEQLYSAKGLWGMLMGEYYRSRLALNTLEKSLSVDVTFNGTMNRHLMKPVALARTSTIFKLTYFPDKFQDGVVSFPTLTNLADGQFESVHDIPMRYMVFKFKEGITDEEIDYFIRSVPTLTHGAVQDIRNEYFVLVKQVRTIKLIFQLVTVFTMLVSFFSLNSSMFTNIMEQSKEVGILRALGLGKLAIYRIYTYEAFVLVFTSAILGTAIGTLIGWSIAAQRALFTRVPVSFEFPWDLAATVAIISLICALLSTFLPTYRLLKLQVVDIMRLT